MYRDKIFAITLFTVGILSLVLVGYWGREYYFMPLVEKYTSEHHISFGPSGIWGHGLGIIGSIFMLLNFMYSWRKRYEFKERVGSLKLWLEFHMFVGLFGPTLILYHSVFKFNGVIATVCFFSMIVVVLTGIIGRYIYVQIPHNISGAELSLAELEDNTEQLTDILKAEIKNDPELLSFCDDLCQFSPLENRRSFRLLWTLIRDDLFRQKQLSTIVRELRSRNNISQDFIRRVTKTLKQKSLLTRKIVFWSNTHLLLNTWRILHKKLSWILFITLIVHVLVTTLFGFTWIF